MLGSSITIKKNLNYIRLILSLCLVLLSLYNYEEILKSPTLGLTYILLIIISNITLIFLPSYIFKIIKFHYLIFLLDIFLIVTGLTIFTKSDISLIITIFLTIFMAALSKSTGVSLIIAIVVSTIYIYLKIGITITIDIFNEEFLLHLPFVFIVSLYSTYLAEKVEEEIKEKLQLEKINKFLARKTSGLNEEFDSFLYFIENILNNLQSGIIFIDAKGFIRLVNKKCEEIFKICKKDIIDKPLSDSNLPESFINTILDIIFKNNDKNKKTKIELMIEDLMFDLNYILLKDKSNANIGIFCEIIKRER